ncbi:MAG TPA: hypothetical protein VKC15_08660 [Gemmatimonadales bacterium]|nr:hypothetical protein [Gemmatimonadales bacterium]
MRLGPVVVAALVAGACSDALEQDTTAGYAVAVVNSGDNTLSMIDATRFSAFTIPLAPGTGTPTTLAARGEVILVAMGSTNGVRVITQGTLPSSVPGLITLPDSSGATGVAISSGSLAFAANPNLHSVTQIAYLTGDTVTDSVGIYPQAVAATETRVYVADGNVVGGAPAGASFVRMNSLPIVRGLATWQTVSLSCSNARFLTLGGDGLLYVVCSGTPGDADGKLAVVDPNSRRELVVINGLGESPGPIVYHPSGRLLIASPTEGILEVSALTRSVTRGPGNGIKPAGDGIAGLAVDPRGRVYGVAPGACSSPGKVHVLSAPPDYRPLATVTVGVCPAAAVLAAVPPGN